MFKQLFATMNDALEQIERQYGKANGDAKHNLDKQLAALKTMSDECIEQWLLFEEKLAGLTEAANLPEHAPDVPMQSHKHAAMPDDSPAAELMDSFQKAQGYFKLLMFDEAIHKLDKIVSECPDFLWARLYLALGQLQKGDYIEAYRHFRFIVLLADHPRMLAIAYNAMGCIQVSRANLTDAREFFAKAYQADPAYGIPLTNLQACRADRCEPEKNH